MIEQLIALAMSHPGYIILAVLGMYVIGTWVNACTYQSRGWR